MDAGFGKSYYEGWAKIDEVDRELVQKIEELYFGGKGMKEVKSEGW